ncbi:MAG: response regulator [Oscillospiraceae bacterium]
MRYKVLILSQKPALMKEFFLQSSSILECMSTSDLISDILEHIKVFQPHFLLVFLTGNDEGTYSLLADIREASEVEVLIAAFGDYKACEDMEKNHAGLADVYLRRPLTSSEAAMILSDHAAMLEAKMRAEQEEADYLAKLRSPDYNSKEEPEPEAEEQMIEVSSGRKRLLIIDDDRQVLKVLKLGLEGKYDVTTMANGKVAEKYLENHTADLIILDYEMPVVNGADVFKHLKGIKHAANIPVVFLTGVADSARIMEVMALQPAGYLLKPIDMERLYETIHKVIG